MNNLTSAIVELIRLASTDLPYDVEWSLKNVLNNEIEGSAASNALQSILKNTTLARESTVPICQDTGTPIFYVHYPDSSKQSELDSMIQSAVAEATKKAYLRPNAVDTRTGTNSANNLGGAYFPMIHYFEDETNVLTIDLILKGGGCENVGRQYLLPDESLMAERNLEGVRRVALDTVFRAQGKGCAPGFLGIAVGGDRASSYLASKEIFFEKADSRHPDADISALEQRITREANSLGIGPMGFGGNTTILNTRIVFLHRHPASYFVSVSYMCWAFRRRRMTATDENIRFD